MKPYALIVDDFFTEFSAVRAVVESLEYKTVLNPNDGINYPGICELIPSDELFIEAENNISRVMGSKIEIKYSLLRLSTKDVPQPYSIHSDSFMDVTYSALVYLADQEHCQGGLDLLRNKETNEETFDGPEHLSISKQDDESKWDVVIHIPMKANRLILFPSELIHRAVPAGGFGNDIHDGRLVLLIIFRIASS